MARIFSSKTALLATLSVVAVTTLSSCATVVVEQKRSALDTKCQERVIRMLNAVSPVVIESNTPQNFCTCFTAKVDVVKLEKDVDGVKDIGLNPETLRFVTEYIPTIRGCAKETGLWKGL
jgi:glycerol-3-phosphate cytidylyltransferase-like family protein